MDNGSTSDSGAPLDIIKLLIRYPLLDSNETPPWDFQIELFETEEYSRQAYSLVGIRTAHSKISFILRNNNGSVYKDSWYGIDGI